MSPVASSHTAFGFKGNIVLLVLLVLVLLLQSRILDIGIDGVAVLLEDDLVDGFAVLGDVLLRAREGDGEGVEVDFGEGKGHRKVPEMILRRAVDRLGRGALLHFGLLIDGSVPLEGKVPVILHRTFLVVGLGEDECDVAEGRIGLGVLLFL